MTVGRSEGGAEAAEEVAASDPATVEYIGALGSGLEEGALG